MKSTENFKSLAPRLFALGYEVIPVHGKTPTIDAWQSVDITKDVVEHWATNGQAQHNVGVRCGKGAIPIYGADVDFYDLDVARAVRKSFAETFGEGLIRVGNAPKSMMIYRGKPGHPKINSPRWRSPDGNVHKFEFLGDGQQFAAYGTHPDTGKPYRWPNGGLDQVESWELPELECDAVMTWVREVLPTLIPSDWEMISGGGSSLRPVDDILDAIVPPLDIDRTGIDRVMSVLDPDMDHDNWATVGMGLHHQFDGGDEGLEIWDTWSKPGKTYDGRLLRTKWVSFSQPTDRRPVTFASVIKMAHETPAWAEMVKAEKEAAFEGWLERIRTTDDAHGLEQLARDEIAYDKTLTTVDLARVASELRNKMRSVGVPISLEDVKKMLKPRRQEHGDREMPEWCDGYVWCQFEDKFVHVPTQEGVSVQSFNAKHGRDVRGIWTTPEGFQMQAAHVALQELQIPVVSRRMYLPSADERFEMNGLQYLNKYRTGSVPAARLRRDWTTEDRAAVRRVIDHLEMLCKSSSAYLIWWMAHNVQKPGVKIRNSPLIKGIEGDGKSLLGEILAVTMGQENVRVISPKVLLTDFNGWAEGHCVGVFEELKIPGHSRYDCANAIKPNITNDTIPIHRKGMDEYNVINTANYIGFTNWGDALPLTDTDRRWHVIFSPFSDYEQLKEAVKDDAYFDKLFQAIREHSAALRGWLLECDIDAFDRNGRAPDSAAKNAMVAAGRDETEEDILEIITRGAAGVSKDIISTGHLTNQLKLGSTEDIPKGRTLAHILLRLGYMKREGWVWWNGQSCRVWVKNHGLLEAEVSQIKGSLDLTVMETVF